MINAISSTSTYTTTLDAAKLKARQEEMFAKMDTNGDGTVDKTEFTAFTQKQQQTNSNSSMPSADEIFAKMDTDGDGSVSKAEFEAFKPPKPPDANGTHGKGDLSKMFSKIDTDGDGTISKSEFEAFLEQLQEKAMSGATDSSTSSSSTGSSSTQTLTDYLNQEDSTSSTTYQSSGLSSATTPDSVLDLVG